MEKLRSKLNGLAQEWKAQNLHNLPCNIPLQWEIRDGIVYLDGIWIVPVSCIRMDRLDNCDNYVGMGTIEIPTVDGILEIIITRDEDDVRISAIDRFIHKQK